jgi:hypothetical protein
LRGSEAGQRQTKGAGRAGDFPRKIGSPRILAKLHEVRARELQFRHDAVNFQSESNAARRH